jgi:hypothetical protein
MSAAGIHDDAGAFPCFDKSFAGVRAVELQNEVVQIGDLLHQTGGVGIHFFQERAAVHNLAARIIHHVGKSFDGGGEGGNAGGVHAASGCAGFGLRGGAEVTDGGGLVEQVLGAELHNLALGHVHFAEIVEVVGFLEMGHEGAGKNIGGIFEGGFGLRFGVACATGGGSGQGCLGRDGNESGLEFGQINGEIGRFIAVQTGLFVVLLATLIHAPTMLI